MHKHQLLWADDDWTTQKGLQGFLEDHFEVTPTASFEQARDVAHDGSPTACLLDVILPFRERYPSLGDYVGITLARKICNDTTDPPAIIMFYSVVRSTTIEDSILSLEQEYGRHTKFSFASKIDYLGDPEGLVKRLNIAVSRQFQRNPGRS